ncbi:WD40/YVTN/BNR-like repeat-containing protein [Streptomyces sp. NPDC053493]|uniref:WD40/YVTN/BNR-like repeat-containing protein n=1 Tax=Streptomyces sp. NPDC053493 TaxID=3365705 RepID=UPI0037D32AC2
MRGSFTAAWAALLLMVMSATAACTAPSERPGPGPGAESRPGASSPARPAAPSPGGAFGAPARIASAPGLPGWAHSVGFAADGSGFALLVGCVTDEARPADGFCRQQVAALDPGARAWALRATPLPEIPPSRGVTAGLTVLGPGRAVIEDGGGEEPERTWFTGDGGRSWRAVERRSVGTAPLIPEGAALATECVAPAGGTPDECVRARLVVISPQDGRRRALARVPALGDRPLPAAGAEPDGSWWVSGTDPSGRVAVAFSRDAGRSWTVSRLPGDGAGAPGRGAPGRGVSVAVGPDAVYAAELGELPGEPVKNPVRALHRSLDGGRTWTRMRTTGRAGEPRTLLGLPVPGPGGRVTVHGELSAYVSTDGGRTFRPAGEGTSWIRRTGVGLLRESDRCRYATSRDGLRWSEFSLACEDGGAGG